jgi:hypothetical protein
MKLQPCDHPGCMSHVTHPWHEDKEFFDDGVKEKDSPLHGYIIVGWESKEVEVEDHQ